MSPPILVLNAGSSSIKFSLYSVSGRDLSRTLHGQVEGIGTAARLEWEHAAVGDRQSRALGADSNHAAAIRAISALLDDEAAGTPLGIGHRVVHGGPRYNAPVVIDDVVVAELERLVPLAPLHQPHALAGIHAMRQAAPGVPQVASFDTAFHHDQSEIEQDYALPRDLTAQGLRRYGFHGISYDYIASVLPPELRHGKRVVVAHLGNGASMCAMHDGRSVASTMGFTALDGLPMGTRSGTIDPGLVLYLLQQRGMSAAEVEELLYQRSGLIGMSGVSSDMRTLLESDAPGAALAVEIFCWRIARELGSLAAALGGIDGLIFTAGIGAHAAPVRQKVMERAAWLGITPDPAANAAGASRISTEASRVSAWRIPTNENLMIARHVLGLVRR